MRLGRGAPSVVSARRKPPEEEVLWEWLCPGKEGQVFLNEAFAGAYCSGLGRNLQGWSGRAKRPAPARAAAAGGRSRPGPVLPHPGPSRHLPPT